MQNPSVSVSLAPGAVSEPISLGLMSTAGHVAITATDKTTLYLASFKIGNRDRIGGNLGVPINDRDADLLAFEPDDVVTLRLRNTGTVEQHVLVNVRWC